MVGQNIGGDTITLRWGIMGEERQTIKLLCGGDGYAGTNH